MVLELGAQQRSNVLKPTVPSALVKTTTGRAQLQLPVWRTVGTAHSNE